MGGETDSSDFPQIVQVVSDEDVKPDVPLIYSGVNSFFFFLNLFVYGCARSLLLHVDFLELWRVGAALQRWCVGFSSPCPLLLQSKGSRARAQ